MKVMGVILLLGGIVVSIWLGIYVMLVGGILGAIHAYQIGNITLMVWNIIRVISFELGVFIGVLVSLLGIEMITNKDIF